VNKTLMIVEDDQSFHDLYDSILEDTGYTVIHAYDVDDALAKLEDSHREGLPKHSNTNTQSCIPSGRAVWKEDGLFY